MQISMEPRKVSPKGDSSTNEAFSGAMLICRRYQQLERGRSRRRLDNVLFRQQMPFHRVRFDPLYRGHDSQDELSML